MRQEKIFIKRQGGIFFYKFLELVIKICQNLELLFLVSKSDIFACLMIHLTYINLNILLFEAAK